MKNLRTPLHNISISEQVTRFDSRTEILTFDEYRYVIIDEVEYFFATDLARDLGYVRIDIRANRLFKHTYRLGKFMLLSRNQVVHISLSRGRSDIANRFVEHLNFDYEAVTKAVFIANVLRGLGLTSDVLALKNDTAYPIRIEKLFVGHSKESNDLAPWTESSDGREVFFDFEQPLEELFQNLLYYLKTRYKTL